MQESKLPTGKIVFRQLMPKDVAHLLDSGFSFGEDKIAPGLEHRLLHAARLIPREMGLVAYHVNDKRTVGYLQLVRHAESLYSIRFVFTSPQHRRMGVASGLLHYASSLAEERGGKKMFLTVKYPDSDAARLYLKLGFRIIADTSVVYAMGFPKLPFEKRDQPFSCDLHSETNKHTLYNIYRNCMGSKWMGFFETSAKSMLDGFSEDYGRSYFKTALVNDSANSIAIVFLRPLQRKAAVELYTASDEVILPMLNEVFRILKHRGVTYASIALLSVIDPDFMMKDFGLLGKMDFGVQLMFMGKSLALFRRASGGICRRALGNSCLPVESAQLSH